jgi:hypothetical protein
VILRSIRDWLDGAPTPRLLSSLPQPTNVKKEAGQKGRDGEKTQTRTKKKRLTTDFFFSSSVSLVPLVLRPFLSILDPVACSLVEPNTGRKLGPTSLISWPISNHVLTCSTCSRPRLLATSSIRSLSWTIY